MYTVNTLYIVYFLVILFYSSSYTIIRSNKLVFLSILSNGSLVTLHDNYFIFKKEIVIQ